MIPLSLLFAASLLPLPAVVSTPLSQKEQAALVFAALPPRVRKLPGLDIEAGKVEGRFKYFTVIWAQPLRDGSVVAGNYAVDLLTGDVFSSVIGCEERKTTALRSLQRRVHVRLGLSKLEYRSLKSKGPLCDE